MRTRPLATAALATLALASAGAALVFTWAPPTLVEMVGGMVLRGHGRLVPSLAALASLLSLAVVALAHTSLLKRAGIALAFICGTLSLVTAWSSRRGVQTRDVAFASEGGQRLGTLFQPASDRSCAVIVLGHGSGWMSRHLYDEIGARFARAGFSLLNFDKPGVGDSEGEHDPLNNSGPIAFRQISEDLVRAAAAIQLDSALAGTPIGAFGISQAGWTIPSAAARQPLYRFIALLSGPTASTGEESLYSELSGEDSDHQGKRPPRIPFEEINRRVDSAGPSGFDPLPDLRQLQVPGLWLFGEWDNSIPVHASVQRLDRLREEGHQFKYHIIPYANHGLINVRGPSADLAKRTPATVWEEYFRFFRSAAVAEYRTRGVAPPASCGT